MFHRLVRSSIRYLFIMALFGLFISPGKAHPAGIVPNQSNIPSRTFTKPKEVSPELLELFGDGLSEQEFFDLSDGDVSTASIHSIADMTVVIIEMEQDPLADILRCGLFFVMS